MVLKAIRLFLALFAFSFLTSVANADNLTFNVSGTFEDSTTFLPGPTLSGEFNVDTVAGIINWASFTVGAPYSVTLTEDLYSGPLVIDANDTFTVIFLGSVSDPNALISVDFQPSSFIGYSGQPLCDMSENCPLSGGGWIATGFFPDSNDSSISYVLESGAVTSAVPEPAPASLLLVGLVAFALVSIVPRMKEV